MQENLGVALIAGKGRGVIALRSFAPGELIERAPVVVLPDCQSKVLEQTGLKDYYFSWGENAIAIPLGLSLLYNHSEYPNAAAIRHVDKAEIEFVATCNIEAGQEITHRYACAPWFAVAETGNRAS